MPLKKTQTSTASPTKTIIGVNNILAIFVLLSAYFYMVVASFYPTTLAQNTETQNTQETNETSTVSVTEYQQSLGKIYKEYEKNPITAENTTVENSEQQLLRIQNLKQQTLALRVPTEFMNLHLEFTSALTEIQNGLTNGINQEMIHTANQSLNELGQQYEWLTE